MTQRAGVTQKDTQSSLRLARQLGLEERITEMLLLARAPSWTYERTWSFMLEQTIDNIADAERLEDAAIVTVRERLDVFNAPPLMAEFDRLLDDGAVDFIVDLSAVRAVDGDGDYPLLHLLKSVQNVDGSVILVCPPGNPIGIFYEMMHLNTLFDVVDSLDEALAKLALIS